MQHAARSRAILLSLAVPDSLEQASAFVFQVSKAAFFELPGFLRQV